MSDSEASASTDVGNASSSTGHQSQHEAEEQGQAPPAPNETLTCSPEDPDSWIANYLLQQKLYLTALEFHAELMETGTTNDGLATFFADDANFTDKSDLLHSVRPSDKQPYKKSAGASPGSSLLKDKDATISFLQYELRVANEDLGEARDRLTELQRRQAGFDASGATGGAVAGQTGFAGGTPDDEGLLREAASEVNDNGVIPDYERRVVNCLVNQYLVDQGYRLTAITFSDEVDDQDLNDTDDVGLNPETAEILRLPALHRYFKKRPKKAELELEQELHGAQEGREAADARAMSAEAARDQALQERDSAVARVSELRALLEAEQEQVSELTDALADAHQKGARLEQEVKATGQKAAAAAVAALEARQAVKEAEEAARRQALEQQQSSNPNADPNAPPSTPSKTNTSHLTSPQGGNDSSGYASPSRIVKDPRDARPPSPPPPRSLSTVGSLSAAVTTQATTTGDGEEVSTRIAELERDGDAVTIVASCLPFIIPNVLLNKREELLPVILCVIRQHDDPAVRDKLTGNLFNLIKKPDDTQRRMIMDGCVALARGIGAMRVEEELLPQCWEQIDHKYAERRVLVAESCGALAPYVRGELRGSLLLSICLQLLDDKSPLVRAAVARNLGRIVTLVSDPDKFTQLTEVFIRLLFDSEEEVSLSARDHFLPHLADFSHTYNKLCEGLYTQLLDQVFKVVQGRGESGENGRVFTSAEEGKVQTALSALIALTPLIHEGVLLSLQDKGKEDEKKEMEGESDNDDDDDDDDDDDQASGAVSLEKLQARFDAQIKGGSDVGKTSQVIDWLACDLVPKFLRLSGDIDAVRDGNIATPLNSLIQHICAAFGHAFVEYVVDPMFATAMSTDMPTHDHSAPETPSLDANPFATTSDTTSTTTTTTTTTTLSGATAEETAQARHARARLVQPYITGVLSTLPEADVSSHLTKFITNIALEQHGWLRDAHLPAFLGGVHQLCLQDENWAYTLMQLGWDQLTHHNPQMRVVLSHLFDVLASVLNSDTIAKRIVPALITLGSDADTRVRTAVIPVFCAILVKVIEPTVRDKVQSQLQAMIDDPSATCDLLAEMTESFTELIPIIDDHVRESFVVPQLTAITQSASEKDDTMERVQLYNQLWLAYGAFSGCAISPDVVTAHLIPSISLLLNDPDALEDEGRTQLTQMLSDLQGQGKLRTTESTGAKSSTKKSKFLSKFKKKQKGKDTADNHANGDSGNVSFSESSASITAGGDNGEGGEGTDPKVGKFKQRMRSFTLKKKKDKANKE